MEAERKANPCKWSVKELEMRLWNWKWRTGRRMKIVYQSIFFLLGILSLVSQLRVLWSMRSQRFFFFLTLSFRSFTVPGCVLQPVIYLEAVLYKVRHMLFSFLYHINFCVSGTINGRLQEAEGHHSREDKTVPPSVVAEQMTVHTEVEQEAERTCGVGSGAAPFHEAPL